MGRQMADSVTTAEYSFSHSGTCPVCEKSVTFSANGPYFRRTLKCSNCGCEPRHRAFMHILKQYFPDWENLRLHESSPGWDPVSTLLVTKNKHYIASQYDPNVPSGDVVQAPRMPCRAYRSENLEAQTFADESFDLVVTLDVFEHIFHPDLAIREIARTLKPGGATLMTVPIVQRLRRSQRRAALVNGEVKHILPAEFHGNPISGEGSIVTVDWGYDIVSYLQHHSALSFIMCQIDNIDLGIRADFNEILIGLKHPIPAL
jgi:SAM-dependent methyltransferase